MLTRADAHHGHVRAAASVPAPGAAGRRPNIIVVMTDDERVDDLAYMPHVRRLLMRQGTTLRDAVAPTPMCVPARASLLSGQYATNHGAYTIQGRHGGFKAFSEDGTLPVWLHDAGYRTYFTGKYLNGYGDPGTDPRQPGSGFTTYQHNDGHYSGNKLTWLARASYDFSKDFLGYASVSTGYKSGGLQDGGREYGPEELTNYELGIKNTFFGGKVTWNNAVYYADFTDFQFSAPVTNPDGTHSLATSNAEGAKVWGIESELAAKVTHDDRVQLSMAYTHTELGELIAGSNDYALPSPCVDRHGNPVAGVSNCLDVTGNELPHAPSFAAQLNYEHSFHLANGATLAPRVAFHYETASWLSVFNLGDGDQQDGYTRTDLAVRYTAATEHAWYVDVFVRNVEDDDIKTSAQNAFGVWQSQYLAPRTYGANFGMEF